MQAMNQPDLRLATGPSVWRGANFRSDMSWLRVLSAAEVRSLVNATHQWAARDFRSITQAEAEASLQELLPTMNDVRNGLSGRGFMLLRGVPVQDMNPYQIQQVFWGIGLLLGHGLTQNAAADFLCPVTDRGVDFGYNGTASQQNVRGYQSRADLNYHCDPTDVVALLCVRKALSGGKSSIVSTPAIYNAILNEHPEHLPVLMRGFSYDRKAEEWLGEEPVTPRIPIFMPHGQRVSCRYARSYIIGAAQKTTPLTDQEIAALDCFDAIARREDMPLQMEFEPGDVQLLNNLTVVHGRTAYEDHAEVEHKRFLWRLWLNQNDAQPWVTESETMRWSFARFGNLGRSVEEWAQIVESTSH